MPFGRLATGNISTVETVNIGGRRCTPWASEATQATRPRLNHPSTRVTGSAITVSSRIGLQHATQFNNSVQELGAYGNAVRSA